MDGKQLLIRTLFIMLMIGTIIGCSASRKSAQEKKPVVRQEGVQPISAADEEAFKQKIAELGIPLYKGATFVEVRKKSKDSPLIYAVYDVVDTGPNAFDDMKNFYSTALGKTLGKQGWAREPSAKNIIVYRKGFEIVYVDFSKVIVLPDMYKIRMTFNYGQ